MNKLQSVTLYSSVTELVTDNTEFVVLSEEAAAQSVVLQSPTEGDVSTAQHDGNDVVVSLLSRT